MAKLKFAFWWAASCGGCEVTVLDTNEKILDIAEAADIANRAGVGHLVMIHYDQDYADDEVDTLRDRCRGLLDEGGGKKIQLTAAAEGMTLDV